VTGVVVTGPSPNNRIDPYAILSGASVHQGLAPDGPHPWRGRDPDGVFPALLLMFPHYECLPVGPMAASERCCAELVARLVDWSRSRGLRSVVFEYLTPEADALLAALRRAGFAVTELAARCDLPVTWADFDGYLGTLPSKRRIEVRRELRALAESGVRVTERRLRADEPDLVRLRCQLVAKYANTPDPAKEAAYLDRVRATFAPEEISVFEAVRDDSVLGFGLFIRDGDTWLPMASGGDYTDPASRLTYFATLFYRPAELAPQRGVRLLPYGLGSWAAKRARGCRLNPLYAACLTIDDPPRS
jgi:predicted N-acyltransferase